MDRQTEEGRKKKGGGRAGEKKEGYLSGDLPLPLPASNYSCKVEV